MRGGFVAVMGDHDPKALQRAVGAFQWHRGDLEEVGDARLTVVALVQPDDGPVVEVDSHAVRVVHSRAGGPLDRLEGSDERFAAVESDGVIGRASRDAFGQAPLFHRRYAGARWFSTEISPLVALGDTSADLDAVVARMAYQLDPRTTGWVGIERILPGTQERFRDSGTCSSQAHWDPAALLGTYRGSRESALEEFRRRLSDSVARCHSADSGLLLSGGLDSAAVAAFLPRASEAPQCIHVSFPTIVTTDERDYARDVADSIDAPLEIVAGPDSPWDPEADLRVSGGVPYDWLPYGIEEPALERIAESGRLVALDGHDGDGVCGPPGAEFGELATRGRWLRLAQLGHQNGYRRLARGVITDLVPPQARVGPLRRFRPSPTMLERVEDYFDPVLRASVRYADHERSGRPALRWRVKQLQALLPGATVNMEQKEVLSARYGVDLRHPFASRRLASLMISLPCSMKADPSQPKAFVHDAMAGMVPHSVISRRTHSNYLGVVRHRVDPARCFDLIHASGVRLPGIDYGRLFRDADRDLDQFTVYFLVYLTRAHVFGARAEYLQGRLVA